MIQTLERPERPSIPDHADPAACDTPNPPFWCEDAMSVPIDNYIIALILIALIIAFIYLRRKTDVMSNSSNKYDCTKRGDSVSSSCGCVISWGVGFYDVKEEKNVTHNVTNISVDSFSSMVKVTIEKGLKVYTVDFSMEHAQRIGFINLKALSDYC